jgi:penicillin-binding protein 1A
MTSRGLPRDLSLALGSGSLTPIELLSGYTVFANGGYRVDPWFVEKVEDMDGNILYRHAPEVVCGNDCGKIQAEGLLERSLPEGVTPGRPAERVIDDTNAYQVVSMMQDVVRSGTGAAASSLKRRDIAGKTGTTNDQVDAWFGGFSPDVAAIVWIGFDESKPLGKSEAGGKTALPAWIDFMKVALKKFPENEWQLPAGMVTLAVDSQTGLQANAGDPNTIMEIFRADQVPEKGVARLLPTQDADIPEQIF